MRGRWGVWLAATAAGQQLILSRETGSPRSGQRGGQKAMTQGVKEQTSQRGTSSKAKAPLGRTGIRLEK